MTSLSRYTGGHIQRQGLPPSFSGGTSKPQEREDGQLEILPEVQSFRHL